MTTIPSLNSQYGLLLGASFRVAAPTTHCHLHWEISDIVKLAHPEQMQIPPPPQDLSHLSLSFPISDNGTRSPGYIILSFIFFSYLIHW